MLEPGGAGGKGGKEGRRTADDGKDQDRGCIYMPAGAPSDGSSRDAAYGVASQTISHRTGAGNRRIRTPNSIGASFYRCFRFIIIVRGGV